MRRRQTRGGSVGSLIGFLVVSVVLVAGTYYGLNWALNADRGLLSLAVGVGSPALPTPIPVLVASPTPRPTSVPTAVPSPTPRMYLVKPGDTLTRIAREHDTTVDDLVAANHLDRRALLSVGQQLVIPPRSPVPSR